MTGFRQAGIRAMLRPIAHRGLHDRAKGRVENTQAAFEAALSAGVAIECDVRPSADGGAIIFHDAVLDRLTNHQGPVSGRTTHELIRMFYPGTADRIFTLDELLELIKGRVPLFVEIKNEWSELDRAFLEPLCRTLHSYSGQLAVMSFDPAVMVAIREIAPQVLRGIVACRFSGADLRGTGLTVECMAALSDLLKSRPAAPDFINYRATDLPTPVVRYVREVQGLPVLAWTVRTEAELALAAVWSDAAVFEALAPVDVARGFLSAA